MKNVERVNCDEDGEFERLLSTGGADTRTVTLREGNLEDEAKKTMIEEASHFSNAGLEQFNREEFGAAVSLFWMSVAYERLIGSPFGLANDYGNLGNAYFKLGDLEKARAALDESLRLYIAANSATGAAKTYYSLSQLEIRKRNWLSSRQFAKKSLLLFEKHQHRFTGAARELLQWIDARIAQQRQ